jgi:hypothetical protein
LAAKLGIKEGSHAALVGAPDGFEALLAPLPPGSRVNRRLGKPGALDIIVVFVKRRAALEASWDRLTAALTPAGMLWVAWPKKVSKVPTDMTEDVVRAIGLPRGWVDTKVCAVDEVWSGLRLVLRVSNRPPARR